MSVTSGDLHSETQPRPRDALMDQHRAARERREQAALGSDAYREAADEVARIEIAIAQLEEPPPEIK